MAGVAHGTVEKWADPAMPVTDGVVVWLDAARQAGAWRANGRDLAGGDTLDALYDGSGHGRDFLQTVKDAQPKFVASGAHAAVRFDGKGAHLRAFERGLKVERFTVFVVACARGNPGRFRGFLAANRTGRNDYESGLNIDMGPRPSNGAVGIDFLNVEGPGFIGAKSLIKSPLPFEEFHVLTVTGDDARVSVRAGGQPGESRERKRGTVTLENLVLGGRVFANDGTAPSVGAFVDGDIAEVIIFDRALPAAQVEAVEKYLSAKHDGAAEALARAAAGEPLKTVENPPPLKMFVPGFTYRKLPIELTNVNNVRYREDGKLVALAYDGNVYLLSDTDGDGLEDKAELWWDNKGRITSPVGMALTPPGYPRGRGMFIAAMGKVSLLLDTDGDDRGDTETVVAQGWPKTWVTVDAAGVALAKDGSVYFGLGTQNFIDPYLRDESGKSRYDVHGERGTIMKIAPDFSRREVVCTGVRWSVGLAFNAAGDLFCTDQEGATWAPNGNPFDELLHIQKGRHYGFPARHPKHLPDVIDEPSTFNYAPQHQSTCGLTFNEGTNGGPSFGPAWWRGDALVCGESRGKLFRTTLAKTPSGYVAQTRTIGSMPSLLIDSCVSPAGDLVLTCHSGAPDWGSGPTGKGMLYKVRYEGKAMPQPVGAWQPSPGEVHVAFDRAIDDAALARLSKSIAIESGELVGAGDRFETMRPGYAIAVRQARAPRRKVPVQGVQISGDRRTLILAVPPQRVAVNFGLTLDDVDLAYDLHGVAAEWKSSDGRRTWSGWLPHPDLSVSRAFTIGSAAHDELWKLLATPGNLTLRMSLDLRNMLQPAVQPGSTLDFTPAEERVTVTFVTGGGEPLKVTGQAVGLVPVALSVATGSSAGPTVSVSFRTQESATPRPMGLNRFVMPWAKLSGDISETTAAPIAELKGGDWLRGRAVFFGNEAGCAKCHTVRGVGADVGPDLSNLIHRDYESVVRDVRQPSAALNPDYVASMVKLRDGRVLSGIVRNVGDDKLLVRGEAAADRTPIPRAEVRQIKPSPLSVMPTGILEGIGEAKARDLLTFLLTEPLAPAPIGRKGAPPPRSRSEFEAVMKGSKALAEASEPAKGGNKPLNVLLVTGPKDHGPSEHDYPAFATRWTTLLNLADDVKVDHANEWPTNAQFDAADVAVFYSANPGWNEQRGRELSAYLEGGGGAVFLHWAVNGRDAPQALADCIGLASTPGIKYRHGALELTFRDRNHPITRGFGERERFVDESYWNMHGDPKVLHLLADAPEDGEPRPLLWTYDKGKGRVFVSILGHYTWTFDDPLFRLLLLRGIAWVAHDDVARLDNLATIGARMSP